MDLKFTASTFEFLCCRVTMAGASIITLTIYRPGSQSICIAFFDELTKLLERLATYRTPVTLTEDINIHFERTEDADACMINEIFTSFGLQHFVDMPTHERGGILDVIVAPIDEPPPEVVVEDVCLSDHMLVSWTVNLLRHYPSTSRLLVVHGKRSRRKIFSID